MKSPQLIPMDTRTTRSRTASPRRTFLVFTVAGQQYGVSSSDVQQITAMAELHRPPGMPKILSGFLNLAGEPIPVVHVRHLFDRPDASPDLWTPLVIVRGLERSLALLVDKVERILTVTDDAVLPLPPDHVLNNSVEGVVRSGEECVLLLAPERLLLEQEARSVTELEQLVRQRLSELEEETA